MKNFFAKHDMSLLPVLIGVIVIILFFTVFDRSPAPSFPDPEDHIGNYEIGDPERDDSYHDGYIDGFHDGYNEAYKDFTGEYPQ